MVTIRKGNVQRIIAAQALPRFERRGFVPWDDGTTGTEGESGMPLSPTSDKAECANKLTVAQLRQMLTGQGIAFKAKDTRPVLMQRAIQAGLLPDPCAGDLAHPAGE